ncbi:14823_t:CDS:2 [Funneliformis caledonium]|uniref:14823_t:CDS:1 n=1 Tax=Funneliformis caledonium TaxID=1117310 RepID=A0A9N9DPZ7_9GLOM|nr:14823_t:CDS:2 [Funneliformis caledonium]
MDYLVFAKEYKKIFPQATPDNVTKAYEASQKYVKLGQPPILIGSRPPPLDTLWDRIYKEGYNVVILDRNVINREKGVDNALGHYTDEVALERNWNLEIWSCRRDVSFNDNNHSQGVSHYVLTPNLNTTFIPLDNLYKIFAWCYEKDNTEEMRVLRITDGDAIRNWSNDDVMECFVNLNLFGWWHREYPGFLLLYFRNENDKRSAQAWLNKNHSEIWIGEVVTRRQNR